MKEDRETYFGQNMEGEIQNFIKVWLTVFTSLGYCYAIGKSTAKPPFRLLAILLVVSLFLYLPLTLTTMHLGGISCFIIAWLANFKLLLFAFSNGPLASDPSISLPRFIALACLPIKIQNTHHHTPREIQHKSMLNYTIKSLVLALLIPIYRYTDLMHPYLILVLYSIQIYITLEIVFVMLAALARTLLHIELEPQFNEPYLSSSLQDFWGRRWNIMVTSILRPTVYDPTVQLSSRLIDRKWAPLPAIMATFVVSGLMHELIFFYIGRVNPTWEITWFFLLHGVCLVVEVAIKKAVKGRWSLPPYISGPLAVMFVVVTGFRLFFPQLLRCRFDDRAFAEYGAVVAFIKDVGRSIKVFNFD